MSESLGDAVLELRTDDRKLHRGMDRAERGARSLDGIFKSLAATAAAAFAVDRMVDFGRASVGAALQVESLQRKFEVAAGSVAAGNAEFEFASDLAEELGLNFQATAGSFANFSVAVKDTALEGAAARDIFESVSQASAAMSLSAADVSGVFQALTQIVSKGTVSAEELRQQLAERLPGAFRMSAEAIGVTEAELNKMLETGQLTAQELLPALARQLRTEFGDAAAAAAQSARANFERFQNAVFELQAEIGKELMPQLTRLTRFLTQNLDTIVGWVRAFGDLTDAISGAADAALQASRVNFAHLNRTAGTLGKILEVRGIPATVAMMERMVDAGNSADVLRAALGRMLERGDATAEQVGILRDALDEMKAAAEAAAGVAGGGIPLLDVAALDFTQTLHEQLRVQWLWLSRAQDMTDLMGAGAPMPTAMQVITTKARDFTDVIGVDGATGAIEEARGSMSRFTDAIRTGVTWLDSIINGIVRLVSSLLGRGGLAGALQGVGGIVSGAFGTGGGGGLGQILGGVLQNAGGSGLFGLLGGGGGAVNLTSSMGAGLGIGGGAGGGIGASITGAIKGAVSSAGSALASVGSSIWSFVSSGFLGATTFGVGALAPLLIKLFGGPSTMEKATDEIGKTIGGRFAESINQHLRRSIGKTSIMGRESEDRFANLRFMLGNIIDEAGIMEGELDTVLRTARETFSAMDMGNLSAAETAEALRKSLSAIIPEMAQIGAGQEQVKALGDIFRDMLNRVTLGHLDAADAASVLEATIGPLKATVGEFGAEGEKLLKQVQAAMNDLAADGAENVRRSFEGLSKALPESMRRAVSGVNRELREISMPLFTDARISVPGVPHLQHGGIVRAPTLAMVGESGPEAVVPLDRSMTLDLPGVPFSERRMQVALAVLSSEGEAHLRRGRRD